MPGPPAAVLEPERQAGGARMNFTETPRLALATYRMASQILGSD